MQKKEEPAKIKPPPHKTQQPTPPHPCPQTEKDRLWGGRPLQTAWRTGRSLSLKLHTIFSMETNSLVVLEW